jgi:hypothetical protein
MWFGATQRVQQSEFWGFINASHGRAFWDQITPCVEPTHESRAAFVAVH